MQAIAQDKQLHGIELRDVLQRRQLDQALSAKEFAVLTGVSYSTAREWFRLPTFPVLQGGVFLSDFVRWRQGQTGLDGPQERVPTATNRGDITPPSGLSSEKSTLSPRAARILAEAG